MTSADGKIEDFEPAKHLPLIDAWYLARGKQPFDAKCYPHIGYVVEQTAAGFLMQTDTDLCMIDLLVSNPALGVTKRVHALTDCIVILIEHARSMGFRRMAIETERTGVKNFARRCGMTIRKGTLCLEGRL